MTIRSHTRSQIIINFIRHESTLESPFYVQNTRRLLKAHLLKLQALYRPRTRRMKSFRQVVKLSFGSEKALMPHTSVKKNHANPSIPLKAHRNFSSLNPEQRGGESPSRQSIEPLRARDLRVG